MPYIKDYQKEFWDKAIRDATDMLGKPGCGSAGELNYLFTALALAFIKGSSGLNYNSLNTVVGALECAKAEFLRRAVGPYEDNKAKENGDVYSIGQQVPESALAVLATDPNGNPIDWGIQALRKS